MDETSLTSTGWANKQRQWKRGEQRARVCVDVHVHLHKLPSQAWATDHLSAALPSLSRDIHARTVLDRSDGQPTCTSAGTAGLVWAGRCQDIGVSTVCRLAQHT